MKIIKIVSGGQTGADRAALDWAIKNGIRVLNVAGPRASKEPEVAQFGKGKRGPTIAWIVSPNRG